MPTSTRSALSLVTTRNELGGNDSIDWKSLDDDGDAVDVLEGANAGKSKNGLGYTIVHPILCQRVTQGKQERWPGNFEKGEALLYTLKRVGPLTIVFEQPVRGVGAQIQERFGISKPGGAPFTGIIRAFGNEHTHLVTEEVHGWSDDGTDGPAIFIGLRCAGDAQIAYVEFDTRPLDPEDLDGDFAINGLSVVL